MERNIASDANITGRHGHLFILSCSNARVEVERRQELEFSSEKVLDLLTKKIRDVVIKKYLGE